MKFSIFFLLIFVLGTSAAFYGNKCDCIMINNRHEPPDDDCNCSCKLPWNNCKWSELPIIQVQRLQKPKKQTTKTKVVLI